MSAQSIGEYFEVLEDVEDSTVITTHGVGAAALLEELKPGFVVLYDADVAFVRAIEVAQASRPSEQMCVYFVVQDNSVEEQKYRSALKAEKVPQVVCDCV